MPRGGCVELSSGHQPDVMYKIELGLYFCSDPD
jgi:hypothetical protein